MHGLTRTDMDVPGVSVRGELRDEDIAAIVAGVWRKVRVLQLLEVLEAVRAQQVRARYRLFWERACRVSLRKHGGYK